MFNKLNNHINSIMFCHRLTYNFQDNHISYLLEDFEFDYCLLDILSNYHRSHQYKANKDIL